MADGKPKELTFDFSSPDLYNPVYLPMFHRKDPFLHFYGSAGSGKSVFVAQKEIALTFAPQRRGRKTIVARRVYETLGKSCWALLRHIIKNQWKIDDCFKITQSPYSIRNIVNDVEFIFAGLDDVEKLKSIFGADRGWLEEATDVKKKSDLDVLGDRLRGYSETQWTLSYNPTDAEHWLNKEIHEKRPAGHFILKTTWRDNIRMLANDPGYEERVVLPHKESNPNHYRVYAEGMWGRAVEGLVYPDYREAEEIPCLPQAYFIDFGWNDPTAFGKLAIVDEPGKAKKQLYCEEIFYETHLTINDIIGKLKEHKVSKLIPIAADSARPDYIEQLRSAGYWVVESWKAPGSVFQGINNVKLYDLRPVVGSKNLFKELGGHSWKNKNGVWLDGEPQEGLDHLLDGIRYACWYLTRPAGSGSQDEETDDW